MSRDEVRSQYLRERGVRVMRFSDRDLLIDPESGLTVLEAALTLPSPTAVGEE